MYGVLTACEVPKPPNPALAAGWPKVFVPPNKPDCVVVAAPNKG